MTQQQSFLSTVHEQLHSVYTIIRLMAIDNCPPIKV